MFKIIGTSYYDNQNSNWVDQPTTAESTQYLADGNSKNQALLVEIDNTNVNLAEYFNGIGQLYFRCLMRYDQYDLNNSEYVSGYTEILSYTLTNLQSVNGKPVVRLELKPVKLNDNGNQEYNPIVKSAIQF